MTIETTAGQSADEGVAQVMSAAQAHHDAGRLREAEALYRQVLRTWPDHPDALHLMGMLAYQVGRSDVAVELINKAIATRPSDAEFYHDLGNVLEAQGKTADAAACFRKAILQKPDHVDAHFNLGAMLHAQGKLVDAAASYANALAIDPDLADAHNNLGIVLQQQGRLDEAIESYRRALARNPDSADWNYNLGNALRDQGNLAQAAESYRKALAIRPDHASAHNNLGAVLQRQGNVDEAIASYRKALSLKPGYADAHCNMGSALQSLARSDEAIASFRAALSFEPNHAIAHNHLGLVEWRRGNLDAAGASFLAAVSANPAYAEAHNNLGNVLNELGRIDAAIASFRRALDLRDTPEIRMSFARCIRAVDFAAADRETRRLVTRALAEPWARPSDLASTAIKLVSLDRDISGCIERAVQAWPQRLPGQELFGAEGLAALAADPLLQALLQNAQVCDLRLERLFTMVRHALLEAATDTREAGDLDPLTLAFYCNVARQCYLSEYVYSFDADEESRAQRLRATLAAALQSGEVVPAVWVAAVAAYFPLSAEPYAEALRQRTWPESVAALLTQQIVEPWEEQGYRQGMRRLTTVEDDVSRRVRQQYEENPYPRWIKLPAAGKTPSLDAYLREQFPAVPFVPLGKNGDLDILVAGCGTGQESIEMAQQFPAARVLAVDLSLSSLAYAKRKTAERGITNVDYAQGDITKLGSIARTFDIISSVGVLHHLEDPMVGWRQLLSLLRPGGFMLLGFYSERARQNIVAARTFIADGGYGSTASEIRRCRQALTAPGNLQKFAPLTTFRDFYVTSEIRDLLFHVQEHRFTLPQIKERLAQLGLDFVGFLVEPPVVRKYNQRFPGDKPRTNLDNWNAFEAEFPDTFISTYAFWAQKPAA